LVSSSQRGAYVFGWWTGLWSTEAKVWGIMSRVVWYWGGDSSVANDPFGAPGSTHHISAFYLYGALWMVTFVPWFSWYENGTRE
jgi:hypothetical protein